MIIKSLNLTDYRNYKNLDINFDEKVNIFFGDNAQGKTNILEAIYLVSTTKSQRGSKDREIINFNSDESHIKLDCYKNNREIVFDYHLRKGKSKVVSINKNPINKAKDIMGLINVVFFSPEDLDIIKNSPINRRRFIDMELCQVDKLYLDNLSKYNKLLKERNLILKDNKYESKRNELLEVYDLRLIEYGKKIILARKEFIIKINEIIKKIHSKLTGNKEIIEIKYEPNSVYEELENKFISSKTKDLISRTTNVGPHRDDIGFYINGIDARIYGSQGQQRTCALSLKLSEIEIIKEITKEKPILLLDDVLSELDKNRQEYLLESISDVQTFITCTGMDTFVKRHLGEYKSFFVEEGKILVK